MPTGIVSSSSSATPYWMVFRTADAPLGRIDCDCSRYDATAVSAPSWKTDLLPSRLKRPSSTLPCVSERVPSDTAMK